MKPSAIGLDVRRPNETRSIPGERGGVCWVPIFIRDSDSYLQLREAIDAAIAQKP
jgi:hypothetical protein